MMKQLDQLISPIQKSENGAKKIKELNLEAHRANLIKLLVFPYRKQECAREQIQSYIEQNEFTKSKILELVKKDIDCSKANI